MNQGMDNASGFVEYERTTRRIAESLERVRADIISWIDRNRGHRPPLPEIALLEAFHAERLHLAAELLSVEQRFMDSLLRALREAHS